MFQKNWRYTAIGDISPAFIEDVIGEFLPKCMTFEENPDGQWFVQTNSTFGKYPMPAESFSFTIFRRDDPRFDMTNAIGLAYPGKASIGWNPVENDETLGLRIWHEVLHASGADSDQMVKKDRELFGKWLKEYYPGISDEFIQNYAAHEHDPFYQKYYYRYLTILLNPLCGKNEVAFDIDFEVSPKTGVAPLEVHYSIVGEPHTWMWKFPGGEVKYGDTLDPVVTYRSVGSYSAELHASDLFDMVVIRKDGCVVVREPAVNPLQKLIDFLRRLFGR